MLRKRKSADRSWIRRGLCAEQLEPRAMLAGDVTVTVSGSTLIVRGDSDDNQIAIVQTGSDEYAVVGLGDTEVERRGRGGDDGDDEENIVVADGIRNITVDLGSGDDVLSVGNNPVSLVEDFDEVGVDTSDIDPDALQEELDEIEAPAEFSLDGTLNVRTSSGSDAVAVIANVGGSVIVDLGSGGSNSFTFDGTSLDGGDGGDEGGDEGGDDGDVGTASVGGSLTARASGGENIIRVEGADINGSAIINTGSRGDIIDIADISTGGSVVINSGSGGDEVFVHSHGGPGTGIGAALVINSGSGNDLIDVEAVSVDGSAVINAGSGNDSEDSLTSTGEAAGVLLTDVIVDAVLTVLLGTGNDTLVATGVDVGLNAIVNAGSGNDDVSIDASEVDNLFLAIMGSGRDRLEIAGSDADKIGLNGGSGTDTLIADFDEDDERVLYIISFEGDEDDED